MEALGIVGQRMSQLLPPVLGVSTSSRRVGSLVRCWLDETGRGLGVLASRFVQSILGVRKVVVNQT